MTATNKSKEIRAKRRYMLEAFVKTGMTSLEALKAIYRLTGGVKGIKPETLQAHKFDTEYKPYTDGIFDGAINAGAPIKTVKGHWRTVGYKQDGTPISLGAYLDPNIKQAKTRSEHRAKDKRAIARKLNTGNKRLLKEQGMELTKGQKRVITNSKQRLNKWGSKCNTI